MILEFFNIAGKCVGSVWINEDGTMDTDAVGLRSIVTARMERDGISAKEAMLALDGWDNVYTTARLVDMNDIEQTLAGR